MGVGDGGGAVVKVLSIGASCAVERPSLAPQECSVEPDKGQVRDLVVVLVLVGCSVATEGPLTWDLP